MEWAPRRIMLALGLALAALGCKSMPEWKPERFTSSTRTETWKPTEDEAWFEPEPVSSDAELEELVGDVLTLADLVDVGLRNNPSTRIAWELARAAAAAYGESRGELYPTIGVEGAGAVSNTEDPNDFLAVDSGKARWLVEGGATLSYLLTDFGGRRARIEEAKQALYFANWFQNQKIQDVILDIAKAYYTQQGFRAEIAAAEANLDTATTTTSAAQERLEVGVGTIADLLQAEANQAQVQVALTAALGNWEISRGDLATAVGWPANVGVSIEPSPEELPFNDLVDDGEKLIEVAQENRPILAAALSFVREREQAVLQAKSRRRPVLSASAGAGGQMLRGEPNDGGFIYGAGIDLTVPIFTGGALRSALRKAEADLEAARAGLDDAAQLVISAVWTAYYDFRTAAEQTAANEVFLASATESYDVSLSRFQNGIGDIVELLNAQSLLAQARADLVRSRTRTLGSYAELVHAVGVEVATRQSSTPPPLSGPAADEDSDQTRP